MATKNNFFYLSFLGCKYASKEAKVYSIHHIISHASHHYTPTLSTCHALTCTQPPIQFPRTHTPNLTGHLEHYHHTTHLPTPILHASHASHYNTPPLSMYHTTHSPHNQPFIFPTPTPAHATYTTQSSHTQPSYSTVPPSNVYQLARVRIRRNITRTSTSRIITHTTPTNTSTSTTFTQTPTVTTRDVGSQTNIKRTRRHSI